jgi:AcrR family transcriptional regulator
MTRPKGNADQKLIQAARVLVEKTGFKNLKIRQVAKKANVNLGMFHYHFKNKKTFVYQILKDFYEDFFQKISFEYSKSLSTEKRLKLVMKTLSQFTTQHRKFLIAILADALEGNTEVISFFKANVQRHASMIFQLLDEGQKENWVQHLPRPILMSFIAGSITMPILIFTLIERVHNTHPFGMQPQSCFQALFSDQMIQKRIDLAVKAISKP